LHFHAARLVLQGDVFGIAGRNQSPRPRNASAFGLIGSFDTIPVAEAFIWADREIATLLVDHTDPERLWGVHKLEANTVRTVLIHTMLHTGNTIARPWQQGLQLGAAPYRGGICIFLKSDKPYEGRLQFDIPRHRLFMGFKQDWPRMNVVPEWFTVEPDESHQYKLEYVDTHATKILSGKALYTGLPINLKPDKPLRLIVTLR
jgi:hypothetical protein